MKKINIMLILFSVFLLSLYTVNADITATAVSPTGGQFINQSPLNFTFSCGGNVTISGGNDSAIYNATLFHNISGTWKQNVTINGTGLET